MNYLLSINFSLSTSSGKNIEESVFDEMQLKFYNYYLLIAKWASKWWTLTVITLSK